MKVTPIRELTIGELKDCFAKERFDFEPIYQRKSGVWREQQRLLLIDSILSGYIIPVVIFRQNKHADKWEVVDGSQRLYSIKDYLVDGRKFLFSEHGLSRYEHYDNMTWEQIDSLTPVDYGVYSKERGCDIANLQNFKLYYILIEEATDDEMVQIFSRLNSNEPLSDGEWLNCLVPALPLWEMTKRFADYCFSNNYCKQIYNFLNNKTIHQDFDPMRNMDAWFWANITITLYLYEKNKKLVFLDGKKKDLKEAYENLNKKFNSLAEEEKKFDEIACEAIYSNMIEAMPFFLGICGNMNNDSKRPKNLFIAYIYSYIQRNNNNLLLKIKTNNSVESNKIKVFFGMNIPKKDNEHTIEYASSLKHLYDEINKNNSPSSRRKRYEVFSELMR